ncbi:MAG: hypothetical protein JXO22_18435, partial [Phycisphaerae bacterium]|nr:hypothetical protein [Phycisphaerae bacterium]
MRGTRVARIACGCLAIMVAVLAPTDKARGSDESTSQWLTDLARDYGLRQRGTPAEPDVLHVETLLRAALRLDADNTDACRALYEIAMLRGDTERAAELLDRMFTIQPDHAGIAARWLELKIAAEQTTEARERALLSVIGDDSRSGYAKALACVGLAKTAHERVETEQVRTWLDRANQLFPDCPEAARAAFDLLETDAPLIKRLAVALDLLRLNPLDVEAAWEVAVVLDRGGLSDEAARFYEHAIAVHRAGNPRERIPAAHLLDLARNRIARGQWEEAGETTRQAIREDPNRLEAAFLLHYILETRGLDLAAREISDALTQRFSFIRDPEQWPLDEVLWAAWLHCRIEPQPQRALLLAESASRRAPGNVIVRRVLGWAQAMNFQTDAARATLTPLADTDPYAAYQLALMDREAGDEAAAKRRLEPFLKTLPIGPARSLLYSFDAPVPTSMPAPASQPAEEAVSEEPARATTQPADESSVSTDVPTSQPASAAVQPVIPPPPPPPPEQDGLRQQLTDFRGGALKYWREPGKCLEAAIKVDKPTMSVGEPWWTTFTLTNRSPYPITLGPQWMVNPVILVSFHIEGDRQRDYEALMSVTLDGVRLLRPGESASLRRTLDVGPVGSIARQTPQQLQRITVTAMLDPVQSSDGQWRTGIVGQNVVPVHFNRRPVSTGPDAMRLLFDALKSGQPEDRFRAVDTMAALLGEQQRAARQSLAYQPDNVPVARMRQALLAA